MSSDAYLNQISPYLLDRFKKYPALVDLFCNAWQLKEQINSGVEPWTAVQEMQDEYANRMQRYHEFQYEFQLQPTDFEHIKADIPLMLAESRFPKFNLGTRSAVGGGWDSLHIFLAGTREPNPSFLVHQDRSVSSYLFVNLVGGGQEIGNDLGCGKPRFFEAEAIKEISKALKEIDKDNFQRRWQFISDMNKFSTEAMTDEDVTDFVQFLRDLRKYLEDAVEEGDALLLTVN